MLLTDTKQKVYCNLQAMMITHSGSSSILKIAKSRRIRIGLRGLSVATETEGVVLEK